MTKVTYLVIEIALIGMAILLKPRQIPWRMYASWRFLSIVSGLFLFWLGLDLIAVSLGLWYFPVEGTLPIRILGLPIEEHAIFLIHSVICCSLLGVIEE
jgi:lycopene cyclase domain-containing protein